MSTTGSSSSSSDEDCIIVDVPHEPVQGMSEREPSPLAPWVSIIANESQNMMDEDSSSDEERDVAEVLATLYVAMRLHLTGLLMITPGLRFQRRAQKMLHISNNIYYKY